MTIRPPDQSGYFSEISRSFDSVEILQDVPHLGVARTINEKKIHILVDLNGWVKGERSEVMALRPTGIQMHYMAFLHSMSCDYFDFLVSDPVASPVTEASAFYGEKLLYLPPSFLVTDHKQMELEQEKEDVTFQNTNSDNNSVSIGNWNAFYKVDPVTFGILLDVVKATPKSKLWIQSWNSDGVRNIRMNADIMNLDPSQLRITEAPPTQYGRVWNEHATYLDLHVDSVTSQT